MIRDDMLSPLLLLLFLSSCSFETDSDHSTQLNPNGAVGVNDPKNIIGQWKFVNNIIIESYREDDLDYYQEWTYMYMPDRTDIVFTTDSCFRVDMPVELKEGVSYSIDSRILNVQGSLGKSRYIIKGDTLHLYRYDDWNYIKQTFKRTDTNDSLMSVIKRDTINYAHFAGVWHLQREWNTGMDDGSYYTLNFPHNIPDSIVLTRDQILSTCHMDKSILMRTDGTKKTYTYGYRSYRDFWDRDVGEFFLTPGSWYNGDSVEIHYENYTWYR